MKFGCMGFAAQAESSRSKALMFGRGEYVAERLALERAVKEAYDKGFLGKNACGSGMDFDVMVTFGAGAYICGACFHKCCLQLQVLFIQSKQGQFFACCFYVGFW